MISPSFSLTATERILPRMALDFTTASLDSRVAVARAGNTATCVNSSGNIALVNANLPRFDFNPTTLACNGLLIEEARTNTVRNNTMAGTVAGSPGTNPNFWGYIVVGAGLTKTIVGTGTENGITYIDLNVAGTSSTTSPLLVGFELGNSISALTGQTWSSSTYLRLSAGSLTGVTFELGIAENNAVGIYVTGANYSITTPTSASLITQRKTVTRLLTGGATVAFAQPTIVTTCSAGAVLNFTLRIGLPQMELGAFSTSVIPTSVAQVTRTADVATMTGTNFSDWFNASEGAFAVQASSTNTSTTNAVLLSCHNTATNLIDLTNQSDGQFIGRVRANNANVAQMANGTVIDGATETYAIAYKTASMAVSNKGAAPTTNATAYSFTSNPNILAIGANQVGTQQINGYMRKLMFYPQRIINAEVQAFSK